MAWTGPAAGSRDWQSLLPFSAEQHTDFRFFARGAGMKIEKDRVVSIHYKLTGDDGDQIDSSADGDPLILLHGAHGVIPGVEQALDGREVGDEFQVTVQPDDGYGPLHPELIQSVPRTLFDGVDEIRAGMRFQAEGPNGEVQVILVRDVGETEVSVDGNHPLAGKVLHFDIKVKSVREATPEELEHGHVH